MKYCFVLLLIILTFSAQSFALAIDYETLYNDTESFSEKFIHNLDPYEAEEYLTYAYAPYPLFRVATTLYFKNVKIPVGYYILAARHHKGRDLIFFKESGKIKYIVPVVSTETVLEEQYQRYMPKPELSKWQKTKGWCQEKFYTVFRRSKKQPPPNFYITTQALDSNFIQINYFYANKKYVMIFRTSSF